MEDKINKNTTIEEDILNNVEITKKDTSKKILIYPFDTNLNPIIITEGWFYSEEEKSIHGTTDHEGIDFALPIGTPIKAAFDGYAVSTYGFSWVTDINPDTQKEEFRLFYGDKISMDIGLFVQIYNPKTTLFTQYGHLSKINEQIPFTKPLLDEETETYFPAGNRIDPKKYSLSRNAVYVKKGTVIGYSGISGITKGFIDYPECMNTVRRDPIWDEPHLHFQLFKRSQNQKYAKLIDVYGIYSTVHAYTTPTKEVERKHKSLFIDQ
jgi:murein DD-endopeptidase MepM/ murein hydrolase activator NlpD